MYRRPVSDGCWLLHFIWIVCVDSSVLFSSTCADVMIILCAHLSSVCLIYDTTLAWSLHGSKCPLFCQDRDHVQGLIFDVLLPQKDDVWHGRTLHNDACALQRFDWDRRIYLLRVGCCISLAQLSRHMDTMTLSDYSDSQCWYGRPADLLGLWWCCVRRR